MVLVFVSKQSILSNMEKSTHHDLSPPQPTKSIASQEAESQFDLGLKFASGTGAAQDFVRAAECYRKAASQSHPLAQFNLGIMYAEGQGMAADASESLMWFGRSARLGDAGAQFKLGESFHQASLSQAPMPAAESRIEAYKWYRLAAVQGYMGSEVSLESLGLKMSAADVVAGNARVDAFVIEPPKNQSS